MLNYPKCLFFPGAPCKMTDETRLSIQFFFDRGECLNFLRILGVKCLTTVMLNSGEGLYVQSFIDVKHIRSEGSTNMLSPPRNLVLDMLKLRYA